MKQLLLIPLLLVGSLPAVARQAQTGYSNQCFEEVYREEYIPGTVNRPGRVRRWTEQKEVPCNGGRTTTYHGGYDDGYRGGLVPPQAQHSNVDNNSCIEGSIIGGIAGGAIGGAAATQENWIWSIPAGVIGGALVGCQVDGG